MILHAWIGHGSRVSCLFSFGQAVALIGFLVFSVSLSDPSQDDLYRWGHHRCCMWLKSSKLYHNSLWKIFTKAFKNHQVVIMKRLEQILRGSLGESAVQRIEASWLERAKDWCLKFAVEPSWGNHPEPASERCSSHHDANTDTQIAEEVLESASTTSNRKLSRNSSKPKCNFKQITCTPRKHLERSWNQFLPTPISQKHR